MLYPAESCTGVPGAREAEEQRPRPGQEQGDWQELATDPAGAAAATAVLFSLPGALMVLGSLSLLSEGAPEGPPAAGGQMRGDRKSVV